MQSNTESFKRIECGTLAIGAHLKTFGFLCLSRTSELLSFSKKRSFQPCINMTANGRPDPAQNYNWNKYYLNDRYSETIVVVFATYAINDRFFNHVWLCSNWWPSDIPWCGSLGAPDI